MFGNICFFCGFAIACPNLRPETEPMKHTIWILMILAISACDTTPESDYLVFADGSKVLKKDFEAGSIKGCDGKVIESVPHFDRDKYCACIRKYVLQNSRKISVSVSSGTAEDVVIDAMSYFDSEGASEAARCRDAAVDESKFDWNSERERFTTAFPPSDTTAEGLSRHQSYLDCLWSKTRDSVSVREIILPEFAQSEKLRRLASGCR